MIDKTINSGPDAQNGFALQRNTAIFLLLENYFTKFQTKKYFVCLEHHEDFLFCFLNENDEVSLIEAYQSKKKSPDIWRLNNELFNILTKLLKTGKGLIQDGISKSLGYNHILYFSSNQTIHLEHKPQKSENLPIISVSIKADNKNCIYPDLPKELKEKIKTNIIETDLHSELDNLSFIWIPFTTTEKEQENQLVGKIDEVFGNQIFDKRAAIDTLVCLFRKIETSYNNGNTVKLLDNSKRVGNLEVEKAFNILTSKAKCFDYWHSKETEIAKTLKVRPIEKEQFQLIFNSSFDLFKSIKEREHKKILNFVQEQIGNLNSYTEVDNVIELFELFKNSERTNFNDLQLKAILFAALFEILHTKEN
ncbi:hypothetical protein [Flavobacterium macacae]|uniref:DUF4297 domain-containing protein n=1 Tax=Flavobacterium macacae TaxID=2488993 RepID=A0A3P3W443_9FLAO|nr:hypothetical protein [Flavobacterium macacae]RRJ89730.1 hypothetical protein EG849_12005 [Flavobacterium macacae]